MRLSNGYQSGEYLIIEHPENEDYIPREYEWWVCDTKMCVGPMPLTTALNIRSTTGHKGSPFIRRHKSRWNVDTLK